MMMGEWRWSGNQYKIGVSNRIEVKKRLFDKIYLSY